MRRKKLEAKVHVSWSVTWAELGMSGGGWVAPPRSSWSCEKNLAGCPPCPQQASHSLAQEAFLHVPIREGTSQAKKVAGCWWHPSRKPLPLTRPRDADPKVAARGWSWWGSLSPQTLRLQPDTCEETASEPRGAGPGRSTLAGCPHGGHPQAWAV